MSPCGTWMKLPCLKAEWPRNLPTCGGDCHSMERTVSVNTVEIASCWPGFPIFQLLATSLDAVQSLEIGAIAKSNKSWPFAVGKPSIGYIACI